MRAVETPLVFDCDGDPLIGILHEPESPHDIGLVIVVGGPQYRVGSHRQFVIMARQIAGAGFPVLRFDYRSMGDSRGRTRDFENVDSDIRAAIDALLAHSPSVRQVVLLGLCDAASANLMYAPQDDRVVGLVLLNPWAHTAAGEARAYVRHYYLQRLLQASFWRKVFAGEFRVRASVSDFLGKLRRSKSDAGDDDKGFLDRMDRGLRVFDGDILLQISGRDLTAAEFMEWAAQSQHDPLRVDDAFELVRFDEADHTMSQAADLEASASATVSWLRRRFSASR